MGGVWCKADKGRSSYSPKGPFNTTISRWTDNVRQAYRKPKHQHRPPRPPQKPARSNERLTISAPTLVREASSDGWRTATLIVPETQAAPVPPPRKKRKRNIDLNRSAVSMDNLNQGSSECLNKSTISLPDKCGSDILDSRGSSSTLVVTPVLESRVNHGVDKENKENIKNNLKLKIEEEEEDIADQPEIIPIENETLFTSRLLHSNLGYVDKLSAISEVSAESGFDDKTDVLKFSEGSGSMTSVDSVPVETGLNIMAHIQSISASQIKDSVDIREKTAVSKTEWLQNILKVDPEPYLMSDAGKEIRRGSDGTSTTVVTETDSGQPTSLPNHLHLMAQETKASSKEITTETPTEAHPLTVNDTNHSVLLDIIQKNKETEDETNTPNFLNHKEESIFLTNTKTNIIYKSLSSDNLTDDYDTSYSGVMDKPIPKLSDSVRHEGDNERNGLTSRTHLSDYSFQTPKLVESDCGLNSLLDDKRSNIVSSFDFKGIKTNYVKESCLNSTGKAPCDSVLQCKEVSLPKDCESENILEGKHTDKTNTKEVLTNKDSISSSRKSSITDSLHEFEMSIYDMLKESKKNENSSDEEESLKVVK